MLRSKMQLLWQQAGDVEVVQHEEGVQPGKAVQQAVSVCAAGCSCLCSKMKLCSKEKMCCRLQCVAGRSSVVKLTVDEEEAVQGCSRKKKSSSAWSKGKVCSRLQSRELSKGC